MPVLDSPARSGHDADAPTVRLRARPTAGRTARGNHARDARPRGRRRARAAVPRHPGERSAATRAGAGTRPRRQGARRAPRRDRRRCADARVRPLVRGRRRADVPRGGAAAHPRCRHRRRVDPRQDRPRRLARPSGPLGFDVRQRRVLGAGGHRQAGRADTRRERAVACALRRARAGGRAGGARRDAHRDALPRRAVRARRDDGGSARARAAARGRGLPLLVRHARRGRTHGRRRAALSRSLCRGDARDRPLASSSRRGRRAGALGEAVGAAPALRACPARARDARAAAATRGARDARDALRRGSRDRRRGIRSPRPLARSVRGTRAQSRAGVLDRARPRRPGLSQACAASGRLDACAGTRHAPAPDGPAGQGRVLGRRDQARAGRRPRRLPGLHPQGAHGRRLSRLCPQAARPPRPRLSAVRDPQRRDARRRARACRQSRGFRVPVPARHGRVALRPRRGPGNAAPALPHLRADRHSRDAARLPRTTAARERCEHLVRQPGGRRRTSISTA